MSILFTSQPLPVTVETIDPSAAVVLHAKERERLKRWINAATGGAVVGVLGPEGSGKTRMAHTLAESIASERGAPLMLIACRDRRLPAVLRECVWRVAPDLLLVDDAHVIAQFREAFAARPAVLVLDDLADCEQLSALALPGLVAIVTSRVAVMPVPAVGLREISIDDAVAVLAAESGALPSDGALVKIAGLVQKSPFALSLIAAHLAAAPSVLPSDALRLLSEEHRRLQRLTRHDDLNLAHETALSFAYHRLSVTAQRVLRQLSVIPDAFGADMASFVCDDAALVLPELLRRRMLQSNITGRYAWQPTARAFIRARLVSSESVAAELRHAQGVVALARGIAGEIAVRNLGEALRAFDALRAQIDVAFVRLQPDSHALRYKAARVLIDLHEGVAPLLPARMTTREQMLWLSAIVSANKLLERRRGEAHALGQLALLHITLDDVGSALSCYERLRRLHDDRSIERVPAKRTAAALVTQLA